MLHVDVTAVELDAVVGVAMYLDVIHLGTTAYTDQRNTVDFITGRELIATLGHDDVVQHTAAIVSVVATGKARFTF